MHENTLLHFSLGDSSTTTTGSPEITLPRPANASAGDLERLALEYAGARGFDLLAVLDHQEIFNPSEFADDLAALEAGDLLCRFVFARGSAGRSCAASLFPLPKHLQIPILSEFIRSGHAFARFYNVHKIDTASLPRLDHRTFPLSFALYGAVSGSRMEVRRESAVAPGGTRVGLLTVLAKLGKPLLHRWGVFYDRELDTDVGNVRYSLKLSYPSSHSYALAAQKKGVPVADLGSGPGQMAHEFARSAESVLGVDAYKPTSSIEAGNIRFEEGDLNDPNMEIDLAGRKQIFFLDVIEHLHDPEGFLERLHGKIDGDAELILTTPNIAFLAQRLMLLCGQFNYGRKGILDRTHTRLFTFRSLRRALRQSGFRIIETKGVPAPFPEAFGDTGFARVLLKMNQWAIACSKSLFSFQIFVRAVPVPGIEHVLKEAVTNPSDRSIRSV